jgi:hypothetical protein
VDRLNQLIPERERWLRVPALQFNRRIGQWAHQCWTVEGEPVERERYAAYLAPVLPTLEDRALLADLFKEPDWIASKKGDTMDA